MAKGLARVDCSPESVTILDRQSETLLASLLEKSPGIENPMPRIAYGTSMDALTPEQQKTADMLEGGIRCLDSD